MEQVITGAASAESMVTAEISTLFKMARTQSRRPQSSPMSANLMRLVVIFAIVDQGLTLKCYKCAVYPEKSLNDTIVTHMCTKFEENDDYVVNCEFSTMCLKTIATLHLQNGQKQETIIRGCAQQKDTTQVFRDRQWHQEHSVQEVYTEGCLPFDENNLAGAVTTHCYCRGELCNAAPAYNDINIVTLLLFASIAVIFSLRIQSEYLK